MAAKCKLAKWLSRELQEEVSNARAVYMTLCAVAFLFVILAGAIANMPMALISIAVWIYFAHKAKMIDLWREKKE